MGREDIAILADPEGKCYNFARKVYEYVLKKDHRDFGMELIDLNIEYFRDKEEKAKISSTVRRKSCFFIHDSNKSPPTWLSEIAFANEALKSASASEVVDVLPYLMYSRQDRKDEPRVSLNARVVAETVSKHGSRMMTLDVHSLQIQLAYGIPFDALYSFPTVVDYLHKNHKASLENIVIMSPDLGGAARAKSFKDKLEKKKINPDFAMGYKERPKAGEISDKYIVLGDVKGKNVLLVDDILDSGNTLIAAAKQLKAEGAKEIWAYATHGLFTEGVEKITNTFDKILVSDTVYVAPQNKLEIISMTDLLGEIIYGNIKGYSSSEKWKK